MKLTLSFGVVLLLGLAAAGDVQKRADTLTTISGSLRTSAGIAGNVATMLKLTSNAFPLAGVFTGLFGLVVGFLNNDQAFWDKVEKRMKEIAQEEVANYHDLLAQGFISGIKRSVELFNKFPTLERGQPNKHKIDEGVVISGIINNNRQWVNVELGKSPQKMILYFMEVASVDVAVLYNLAALYGQRDSNHWLRLKTRVGHHITDAEAAAKKVLSWRTSSNILKCESTSCKVGTRKCGPKGSNTCDVTQACKKGIDNLTEICKNVSYRTRCGATACTKYRRECNKYSKTKVGASNCDFFKKEITDKTNRWLSTNVYSSVNMWKNLVKRGR